MNTDKLISSAIFFLAVLIPVLAVFRFIVGKWHYHLPSTFEDLIKEEYNSWKQEVERGFSNEGQNNNGHKPEHCETECDK